MRRNGPVAIAFHTLIVVFMLVPILVWLVAFTPEGYLSLPSSGFSLRWAVFRRITLPLIAPGIVSGWALAFIQFFDQVTMTVFVAAPGIETLPVQMFLYIEDNIDPLVTSVSASVIAVTVVALIGLDRLFGRDRLLVGERQREP